MTHTDQQTEPIIKVLKIDVGGTWCDAMVLGGDLIVPLSQIRKEALKWVEVRKESHA